MKLVFGKISSSLITIGGWLLLGARTVLDLIGYSTAPEDVAVAKTRLEQAISYFLGIPWWALLGFALISTLWLMWVSWPRQLRANEPYLSTIGAKGQSVEIFPTLEVVTPGAKGIYIGKMRIETTKLVEDLVLEIVVLGFNASGYAFEMKSVAGSIGLVLKDDDGNNEKIPLPTPHFLAERGHKGKISNLTEFMYIFEQRIPKFLMEGLLKSTKEKHAEFHFDDLQVEIAADSTKIRLPLWRALTLRKSFEPFTTGRIVFASATATL